ncbi:hypothetical protein [Bilophila wadsworthia]
MDKKENIPAPEENMPDILKVIQALGGGGGIIAILTGSSFLLSIFHNFFYFYLLEIPIEKIPLSIYDYISTFTYWFHAALYGIIIFIINIIYSMLLKKNTIKDVNMLKMCYICLCIILISIILFFIFKDSMSFIEKIKFIIYSVLFVFGSIQYGFAVYKKYYGCVFCMIIILLFMSFSIILYEIRENIKNDSYITMYNNEFCGCILRFFERGVLIYNSNKDNIQFILSSGEIIDFSLPYYLKNDKNKYVNRIKGTLSNVYRF